MRRLLRLAVGVVFVLGGIAKFLPWPEDPYATLNAALAANAGHQRSATMELRKTRVTGARETREC